jgi:hypothetical protein
VFGDAQIHQKRTKNISSPTMVENQEKHYKQ